MTATPATPVASNPAGGEPGPARRPERSTTGARASGPVGLVPLALAHARWSLVETMRIPVAWIGALLFPVLAFAFFVLPIAQVRETSGPATEAIFSMLVFAFMSNGLFSFGLDLASQRAKPWAPYLRTLPGSSAARIAGLIASTLVTAAFAMVPVLVVGLVFTAANPSPLRLVLGVLTVVATSIPAALIGLIIGTTCGEKAAIAVTQVVMFTMAFASGLFMPPMLFPEWLEVLSRGLPVRAARELSIAAVLGTEVPAWAVIGIVVWTVVLGAVGVWLFRRDEGRRYR